MKKSLILSMDTQLIVIIVMLTCYVTLVKADRRCCNEVGCFDQEKPFDRQPLPECPDKLKIKMTKYGIRHKVNGKRIDRETIPQNFDGSLRTVFLVHGWLGDEETSWMHKLKDAILTKFNYNVILVSWRRGAGDLYYPQAAANTRPLGAEIALVVNRLYGQTSLTPDLTWCVGHSLGAHACGHAGVRAKLQRVTGLDPAGPWFEDRPVTVGLNRNSANFVDVIHTNGESNVVMNLGTKRPIGHADFYPNGGGLQPGCIIDPASTAQIKSGDLSVACSHNRVTKLFRESVLSSCKFVSHQKCENEHKLPRTCQWTEKPVQEMGFYADQYSMKGIFYLRTRDTSPFCKRN